MRKPLVEGPVACYFRAMPNREDILTENERLIFDLRPHWVALVGPVFESIVAFAVAIFVSAKTDGKTLHEVVWVLAALVVLIFGVLPFIRWNFTRFLLTT